MSYVHLYSVNLCICVMFSVCIFLLCLIRYIYVLIQRRTEGRCFHPPDKTKGDRYTTIGVLPLDKNIHHPDTHLSITAKGGDEF